MMKSSDILRTDAVELLGSYEVQRHLATTGFSTILLARDTNSNAQVVLKCFDPGHRAGYLREVAAGLNVVHHNIAAPKDTFYSPDGRGCLVYEYFEAGTLRTLIQPGIETGLSRTLDCARDCLEGLIYLHRKKLIHCDIKPENIFIRKNPERIEFVLGDLGATCPIREAAEGRHRTGSPAYAAPERMVGRFAFNSDLYSLGVALFELATGKLPFTGGPREVARSHAHEAAPVHEIKTAFLRDFVAALLEKEPSRRISSAGRALQLLAYPSERANDESASGQGANSAAVPSRARAGRSTIARKQLTLGRRPLRLAASTVVESDFQRLMVLSGKEGPTLLIQSESDFSLVPLGTLEGSRMIPKTGNVLIRGSSDIIYQVGNSICAYDIVADSRTVLHEGLSGILGFSCDENRILWRTKRSIHVMDIRTRSEVSFLLPHYLLEPQAVLLPNGHFSVSTGSMNNEISIRDAAGQELRRLLLDGPVVDITCEFTVQLALTLEVDNNSYVVWRVGGVPDQQKYALGLDVRALAITPGHIFWLGGCNQVIQCGIGLAPRPVFTVDADVFAFSVSPDHRWLLVARKSGMNNVQVSVYSNVIELNR